MFNRANKRFKNTLTSGATADDVRAEPGQFDPILGDGEGVHHICSSTDGFEHETENRTTTLEPGGDADAHLVVTDRRVLGVLGRDSTEPEFAFDADSIARSDGRDGLLSATLEVATAAETVRFTPDDGTDVERVAGTIDRVANNWGDLRDALAGVEAAMDEYERKIEDGVDPDSAMTKVRSRLSQAHHCATKGEYVPDEVMLAEVEPVEDDVDHLRVTARLDRAERILEAAEADDFADSTVAIDTVMEAAAELSTARDVHGEVGSTSLSQRVTDLTVRLDSICESLLAEAHDHCVDASDADDPSAALDGWERALDHYRAMLDAGWDGQANVSAEAIRYQLAWVIGNRVQALRERASALEDEGEEGDETETFERALDCRENAKRIEAECPFGDQQPDTDAVERLEDKIARSEWQWGEA